MKTPAKRSRQLAAAHLALGGAPETWDEWRALGRLRPAAAHALGMRRWDEELWLFPASWYTRIPAGLPIENINGERKKFVPGETPQDARFGMLAFGIRVKESRKR